MIMNGSIGTMATIYIHFDGEEYRIPGPDFTCREREEEGSYYTNDLDDALMTAKSMYPEVDDFVIEHVEE